jgi:hypothetical protein
MARTQGAASGISKAPLSNGTDFLKPLHACSNCPTSAKLRCLERVLSYSEPLLPKPEFLKFALSCLLPCTARAEIREEQAQLFEGEACIQSEANYRKSIQNIGSVNSPTIQTGRRREQPDPFIITYRRSSYADALYDI